MGKYIQKIHLSTWNLDYMITKRNQTLVPNPKYILWKLFLKYLVDIRSEAWEYTNGKYFAKLFYLVLQCFLSLLFSFTSQLYVLYFLSFISLSSSFQICISISITFFISLSSKSLSLLFLSPPFPSLQSSFLWVSLSLPFPLFYSYSFVVSPHASLLWYSLCSSWFFLAFFSFYPSLYSGVFLAENSTYSTEWFIEDQALCGRMIRLLPHLSLLSCQQLVSHYQSSCVDEKGAGKE